MNTREGTLLGPLQQLTHDLARDSKPSLFADGKKMLFNSLRSGNQDIWRKDLETGKEVPFKATRAPELAPYLSPDQRRDVRPTASAAGGKRNTGSCRPREGWPKSSPRRDTSLGGGLETVKASSLKKSLREMPERETCIFWTFQREGRPSFSKARASLRFSQAFQWITVGLPSKRRSLLQPIFCFHCALPGWRRAGRERLDSPRTRLRVGR